MDVFSCSSSYRRSTHQSFTNKNGVSCKFITYALFRWGSSLVECIYCEKLLDFVQCFSISVEMNMWFLSSMLLMWCITAVDFLYSWVISGTIFFSCIFIWIEYEDNFGFNGWIGKCSLLLFCFMNSFWNIGVNFYFCVSINLWHHLSPAFFVFPVGKFFFFFLSLFSYSISSSVSLSLLSLFFFLIVFLLLLGFLFFFLFLEV